MFISVSKRSRSTNFTVAETECLVDEILKRASVIENKRTDAVTWKQKENAWTELTETFNALQSTNRSVKMLKIKYDGIKRTIKQKHNRCKSNMFQTGGGSVEVTTYTSWEEKLLRLISLNVEGLGSENDSDQVEATAPTAPETDIQVINNLCNDEVMEVVMLETETPVPTSSFTQTAIQVEIVQNEAIKWDSWTPARLKTPQSKKLKVRQGSQIPNKYSSLADNRAELISIKKVAETELIKLKLEMEMIEKENSRKEEEHKLKMQLALEEHKTKMELLQLQKNL